MKRYACIFVGCNRCTLRVAQRGAGGKVNILERAEFPVDFGGRIFADEAVSAQAVTELCRIIREYIHIAEQNAPETIEVYISAALRRAINSIYIYERIRDSIKPYPVILMSDAEELVNFCRSMMLEIPSLVSAQEMKSDSLMVSLKGDSFLLASLSGGIVDYITRIPIGYRKLTDMTENITERSETFGRLLTEIITNYIRPVMLHLGNGRIRNIYFSSADFGGVVKLAEPGTPDEVRKYLKFDKDQINRLYQGLKDLMPNQIQRKYPDLEERESETVLFTLVFCRALLESVRTDSLYMMPMDLCNTITMFQFKQTRLGAITDWIGDSGYDCTRTAAATYGVDLRHAEETEYFALRFFDTLKKRYTFVKRERYLLRLCSLLVDVGQYFGESYRSEACEFVINRTEILGLSERERFLCARICAHVNDPAYNGIPVDDDLTRSEQLTCAQLTAVLKLAEAMDAGRKQKINKLTCSMTEDTFTVKAGSSKNNHLEQYDFNSARSCFRQVFGLNPVLSIKRVKI
ncbi:MAG: hypothetical protein ACOYB8_00430 [Eubacteriaceae bacterium]